MEKQTIPTAMGMDYESIKKLNDCRPCTFDTTREQWWYEIGLIDGAEAADKKNGQEDMTLFERLQSVCRYRCAKIGENYKCAKGDNFAETCDKKHCKVLS